MYALFSTIHVALGRSVRRRAVAFLVVSAFVFGACSSSESAASAGPGAVIEASDGDVSVALTVPEGALPDGAELELTPISVDLQPTGLVFSQPVPMDIRLPAATAGMVSALLVSGNDITLLDVSASPQNGDAPPGAS